ncbi:hypothetical protein GE21DRAFT_1212993 [Neurospora crassa]|nr:hypothetical protein B1D1.340 [imported] - Neurospora crassa [Neurospora crassa]KHE82696.1 hypothetical protein GE21DRAFT_1212993 [Neurospora crassa]
MFSFMIQIDHIQGRILYPSKNGDLAPASTVITVWASPVSYSRIREGRGASACLRVGHCGSSSVSCHEHRGPVYCTIQQLRERTGPNTPVHWPEQSGSPAYLLPPVNIIGSNWHWQLRAIRIQSGQANPPAGATGAEPAKAT